MQLSTARLCLDCEEIHDAQVCPVCASETFTFLSRWVPVPEPRKTQLPPIAPKAEVYRRLIVGQTGSPSRRGRLLKRGFIGLTAVGVFGWLWRSRQADTPRTRERG